MKRHCWDEIAVEQMNPTFARQVIHTGRMTIAHLQIRKGGVVPEHHHENEQVSMVLSGKLEFFSGGQSHVVGAGQVLEIPSNVPHSVVALEDSEVFDLFAPIRSDWLNGQDSYLRQPGS